ncbi:hypothetical protein [Sphaerisporangium aureirubrum]|uniref:Antitoxin n=1 Tax=Sphaerisporangium aureirubrum TaxID=1544736 RepID=A0ABW1NRA2_9ACTN
MVALQIRDVPESVREALAAQARARGMSLQGLLLELVTTEARRARNLAVLDRARRRAGGYDARPGEAVTELDEIRRERSARFEGDE